MLDQHLSIRKVSYMHAYLIDVDAQGFHDPFFDVLGVGDVRDARPPMQPQRSLRSSSWSPFLAVWITSERYLG